MTDVAYATIADLYAYGLRRGLLANPARLCAAVSASTDQLELDDHGFVDDDELVFRAESGGDLPPELIAGTTYFAERVSDSIFKVRETAGGSAIDLTFDGASVLVATPLPFAKVLRMRSRWVEDCLPAHLVPLTEPYPDVVVALVARLSAKDLLLIAEQKSDAMNELEVAAKAQLERWAAGVPLRDSKATASANLAIASSVTSDPRGWGGGGSLL